MVVKPPPPVVIPSRSMVRARVVRGPAAEVVCAAMFDVRLRSESVVDTMTGDTDAIVAARGEVSCGSDAVAIIVELGSVTTF